jgi:hypothetical protein
MEKQSEHPQRAEHAGGRRVPFLLYPFVVMWRFFAKMVELMGRATAAILGLLVMILGVILTVTVLGAVVGIPLVIFGFLLVVRAFF